MRVDGVVAALSIVRANRQLQRLRSAIVDRYATQSSSARAIITSAQQVLGILESTREFAAAPGPPPEHLRVPVRTHHPPEWVKPTGKASPSDMA